MPTLCQLFISNLREDYGEFTHSFMRLHLRFFAMVKIKHILLEMVGV